MSRLVKNREYECIYCGIEYESWEYIDLGNKCECGGYLITSKNDLVDSADDILESKRSFEY